MTTKGRSLGEFLKLFGWDIDKLSSSTCHVSTWHVTHLAVLHSYKELIAAPLPHHHHILHDPPAKSEVKRSSDTSVPLIPLTTYILQRVIQEPHVLLKMIRNILNDKK